MTRIVTLLDEAWLGKLPGLGYLQTAAGLAPKAAADLCGVSPETYRRWRADRQPPLYAFRLLAIMAGRIPWSGWDGWYFNRQDNTLNHPDLRDGFGPSVVAEFLYMRDVYRQYGAQNGHDGLEIPQSQSQRPCLVDRAAGPVSLTWLPNESEPNPNPLERISLNPKEKEVL